MWSTFFDELEKIAALKLPRAPSVGRGASTFTGAGKAGLRPGKLRAPTGGAMSNFQAAAKPQLGGFQAAPTPTAVPSPAAPVPNVAPMVQG